MKKVLAVILCAAMLITTLPMMFASAADTKVAADTGSGIDLSEFFTGELDISKITDAFASIFKTFGDLFGKINWDPIVNAIKSAFSDVWSSIQFFFKDIYDTNAFVA